MDLLQQQYTKQNCLTICFNLLDLQKLLRPALTNNYTAKLSHISLALG
jgi:hypothetical protein